MIHPYIDKKELKFEIPTLPESWNKLYRINYNSREVYLSPEGRKFKDLVKMCMPPFSPPPTSLFRLDLEFHSNWYYKKGTLRRYDVQNLDKILIDSIFERLGIDDSHVWELNMKKVQVEPPSSEKECTIVIICIIGEVKALPKKITKTRKKRTTMKQPPPPPKEVKPMYNSRCTNCKHSCKQPPNISIIRCANKHK